MSELCLVWDGMTAGRVLRGALRGESPRTREGRRPDRPKTEERVKRSEKREKTGREE